jgi:hypothetical protein
MPRCRSQWSSVPLLALLLAGGAAPAAACPFSATAAAHGIADDGCAGAPAGPPQLPALLQKYGSRRPPWNVAGVDYHVGAPTGQALRSWQTVPDVPPPASGCYGNPCIEVAHGAGGGIRCNGAVALIMDGYDFTADGGLRSVYSPAGGCTSITVTNSRFGCAAGRQAPASNFTFNIQSTAAVVFTANTVDFTGCTGSSNKGTREAGGGAAAFLRLAAGSLVFDYNYLAYIDGHPLEVLANQSRIDYRFNLLVNVVHDATNHMNFQQLGGGTIAHDVVAFNTAWKADARVGGGGEGFQFYLNRGGTQLAPVLANNTLIAGCCVSYMIHGTGAYAPPTTLSGGGTNSRNYFDPGSSYGAYYPGSMAGWTSAGNRDMTTGAIVVPP